MLSPHFKRSEFKCQCNKCSLVAVDSELIYVLEDVRAYFKSKYGKASVNITSGNRCETHNKYVGGSKKSKHLLSIACDFKVKVIKKGSWYTVDSKEIYDYLNHKYFNKYGIGLYKGRIHLDVRASKARW